MSTIDIKNFYGKKNTNASHCRALEARDSLMEMSNLFLGNVSSLGKSKTPRGFGAYYSPRPELTEDDTSLYEDRLKLLEHLSYC